MKSGFISILGKPNVGKSSLMNALIGEKVSIVSPKAQTTRDRINGILTTDEYQMIFVDTPGVHKPKNRLGEYMEKCVRTSTDGVDAIVIVLDVTRKVTESDEAFIEKYLAGAAPVFVALNKVDESSYERVYPIIDKLSYLTRAEEGRNAVRDIIPTSAKKRKNIDVLKKCLADVLPEGPMYYPADEITDKSERYMIAEIIREKALILLNDEIPHGIAVSIESFEETPKLLKIYATVYCERESHKRIIIGKNGEMLKKIGSYAREDMEAFFGTRVYLDLWIKVKENWRENEMTMNNLGFNQKDLM